VFATVLIVGLFFMWGVANSLNDVLIPQFRKAFQLDDFASSLVQSAFYFGYFCFAIPASLFMRRFGYRAAVLMGLGLYGAGALLFLPARRRASTTAF
jgi:FHS family L-fucose permease-like MFS transporter